MDTDEEMCQVACYEGCEECEECGCANDPEDAFLDHNMMTPEEMKEYLDSLLRNRSFVC